MGSRRRRDSVGDCTKAILPPRKTGVWKSGRVHITHIDWGSAYQKHNHAWGLLGSV